jgi:hypothetical protein
MYVSNLLSMKSFHVVLAGNAHEYSLTSHIGKVRDILLVHNPVAIKNRVGLMADNLFRHLARDPSPVHISRCSSARIV